jgi:protein tyrosine/serine phosphatase
MRILNALILGLALFSTQPAEAGFWRDVDLKIKNFHTVHEGHLYRAMQLDEKEFNYAIKKHGIRTIISLRGTGDGKKWWEGEKRAAAENGVELHAIRMSADRLPHREDLIRLLDLYRDAPRPILIHCKAGADRTGEAAAMYAIDHMGWSKKKALKQVRLRYRHAALFKPAKRYMIKNYEGEAWARAEYDPCDPQWKHYDKKKYCQPGGYEPEDVSEQD